MATLRVTPHPSGISLVLKNGGASVQGWNGTSDSNNPKHQAAAVAWKTRQHTYERNAAKSESDTINSSARPRQYGTRLGCNVEGTADNKWDLQTQWHRMSSLLTRDTHKSFRRCPDIKLVCIASPTSKSLNTIASCLEKLPSIPSVEKIHHSQSVRIEHDRGWPFANRSKGPGTFPCKES